MKYPIFIAVLTLQLSGIPLHASEKAGGQEALRLAAEAFSDAAKKATPAVVSVTAVKIPASREAVTTGNVPFDLGNGPVGIGSGVVIRADGVILTNFHVVENAERVTVGFGEKQKLKAHVLGVDPKTDIAVLRIDDISAPQNLPTISWGNSDQIQVGDWTIAIGTPFGFSHSVTSGIVSAKGRGQLGGFDVEDFIQTDAAINPGNSGGPLLNIQGQMIGLNAAIFSQTGGFIGIGFAIPSNLARRITDEILKYGKIARGWIGITAQDLDQDLANFFKIPHEKGALISYVLEKSPASSVSLQAGDVVLRYNDQSVHSSSELKSLVSKTKAGSKVSMEISRDGNKKQLTLTVKEQPLPKNVIAAQQAGRVAKTSKNRPPLGLVLEEVPVELGPLLGAKPGMGALVVGVRSGSTAFEAGIQPGDVILKANDKRIRSPNDFTNFTKESSGSESASVLYIQRSPEEKIFVSLKPES